MSAARIGSTGPRNMRRAFSLMLATVLLTLLATPPLAPAEAVPQIRLAVAPDAPGDESWAAGFHLPGTAGWVSALAFAPDGSLYLGGGFFALGDVEAKFVARWDGAAGYTLGSGMNEAVWAFTVDPGGSLYAGGYFTEAGGIAANHIARWDGSQWHPLGSGMANSTYPWRTAVRALALGPDGTLYAGGEFTTAGGVAANHIARWDGSQWRPLGSGMDGPTPISVRALAIGPDGVLYAGGQFSWAGGVAASHIARWDGTTWSALGGGVNGVVQALTIGSDGSLYAGGEFTSAGGAPANRIARWDGSAWHALGDGLGAGYTNKSTLMMGPDGSLYTGGGFATAGGAPASGVARWDGSQWHPLGSGLNNDVYALAFGTDGTLYTGGTFGTAGGMVASGIARWDSSAWNPLLTSGNGINGNIVRALARSSDGPFYVGGQFTTAGSVAANHIARWDGAAWQALGSGLDLSSYPVVYALAMGPDGSLYVGGYFPTAGGVTVNNVARWDGTAWHPLGSGMNSFVQDLAIGTDGSLYATGPFTTAGDVSANRIARWDGSTWHPLGDGLGDIGWAQTALTVGSDGSLYVGGGFTTAGGVTVNNVARWDGTAWHSLGGGTNGAVEALAFGPDGSLYAGGRFTTAGGVAANHIARWDGSVWRPLGSGVNGLTVLSLAFGPDGSLYTGGYFGAAGGVTANNIARWDGAQWHPLGSGTSGPVLDLAFDADGSLYVGGEFYAAGDKMSLRIARWTAEQGPPYVPNVLAPIEQPAAGALVSGIVTLRGYAIDRGSAVGTGIDMVHIYLDGPYGTGTIIGGATYGLERPDVAAQYGERFHYSGWQLAWNTTAVNPGPHQLYLYARRTTDNAWSLMEPHPVTVTASTARWLPLVLRQR